METNTKLSDREGEKKNATLPLNAPSQNLFKMTPTNQILKHMKKSYGKEKKPNKINNQNMNGLQMKLTIWI